MSRTWQITIPADSGLDLTSTEHRVDALVNDIEHLVYGRTRRRPRVQIAETAVDSVELWVDGERVCYPPILAARAAAFALGRADVPVETAAATWDRAAGVRETFILELVRGVITGSPHRVFAEQAWMSWLDRCPKSVDILVEPTYLRQLTLGLPREQVTWLRNWLAVDVGLQPPPMHFRPDASLPERTFAVMINGIRLVGHGALSEDDIVVDDVDLLDADPEARPSTVPFAPAPVAIVPAGRAAAAAEAGRQTWQWYEVWALEIYGDVRRHACWLIDEIVTGELVDQLAPVAPVTHALARERLVPRCHRVLAELLADDVSIRPLGDLVEALLEHSDPEPDRTDVRVVRDRLAPVIAEAASSAGALLAWVLDPAVDPELDLEVVRSVVREAIEDLPAGVSAPNLLVEESVRPLVTSALRFTVPEVRVLSYDDIPGNMPLRLAGRLPRPTVQHR
jgi:type III secretory pathway component EscV